MILTYAECGDLHRKGLVLTTGCFDLLHPGHVEHFAACKALGKALLVCVGTDATVHHLKGEGRPVMDEQSRLKVVAALRCVDYAVLSEEYGAFDHTALMAWHVRPEVYAISEGDPHLALKRTMAEWYGVELMILPRTPPVWLPQGVSTTQIVQTVRMV